MSVAADGRPVVDELQLLAWWRDRLGADPVHQIRLQRLHRERRSEESDVGEALVEC